MENIQVIEVLSPSGELQTHIIIDNGDGSFTSMSKEHWDKLEAAKKAQSL